MLTHFKVVPATLAALSFFVAGGAAAQTGEGYASTMAPPPPAIIQAGQVVAVSRDEVDVRLQVSAAGPGGSVVLNDASQARVLLSAGLGAPLTLSPPDSTSFVRSLSLDLAQGQLFLTINATQKVHAVVRQDGATVIVAITRNGVTADLAEIGPTGLTHPHTATRPGDVMEIVPLKYADVSEIVGLLSDDIGFKRNDYFSPQEPAFGSPSGMGQASFANAAAQAAGNNSDSAYGERADDVIGVDRRLNAIVLQGPPDEVESLKAKIAKLDVPVKSVSLETIFVELDESAAKNLGINLTSSSGNLATAVYNGAIGDASATYTNMRGEYTLQAAIQAQVSSGHGKIISKPRISAQSGSTAKIVTGDAIPILTSIALSGVNAVSQQVQYVNVGVTLQIAPRISDDGFISSHIFCEVSSVTGTVQGYPTISQREAVTSATVQDGQAFIIGGLMQEADITSTSGIPGISKIPLLGWLGKTKSGSTSKTDLYIVVIPRVLDAKSSLPPLVRGNSGDYFRQ